MIAIWVGLAAAAGAVCRYLLDQVIQHRHDHIFPWGTFVINVTGSLLIGVVMAVADRHGLSTTWSSVIGAGFIGGYTTWSTLMWESLVLAESGALFESALNVVGSVAVGLAAAAAGFGLGQL